MPAAAVVVEREGTAEQRAPRQVDRDHVREAVEVGGQGLGRGHDEQGVGQAARLRRSGGTTGRLGHRVRAGSTPMTSRLRVRGGGGERRTGRRRCRGPITTRLGRPVERRVSRRPPRGRAGRSRCACPDRTRSGPNPQRPPIHSRLRCPSSRSGPTSACPPRSTRGTRRTQDVARDVARLVASARPGTVAQHVGSSRCRGCRARTSSTSASRRTRTTSPMITDTLLSLGFGRQSGLAPFPPTRPMLTGSVDHDGEPFRIHLHVMPPARARAVASSSRSATRCAPTPRCATAYAQAKREIVEAAPDGDANQLYTVHKGRLRPGGALPARDPPGTRGRARPAPARLHDRGPGRRPARPDARARGA